MPVDMFMRESDAFSWYMERDPALRSTILAIAWLDRSPKWHVLTDRIERASRTIPLFRMHPVEPPVRLSTPRWTVDDDFDLSWHLRRVAAPPPRTPATVLDLARVAATTVFDPAHPQWEFTLVNHLKGGRAALMMKLHHSLTDGVGGTQLRCSVRHRHRRCGVPAALGAHGRQRPGSAWGQTPPRLAPCTPSETACARLGGGDA
jgi:hypothetical protein